jgi:hypothetical protein
MRLFAVAVMIALAASMAGCGGGNNSEPPPANMKAVAGDTSATVSWDAQSGLSYWVWIQQGTTIDTRTCTTCRIIPGVTSPFIVTGLTNGTTYSITVNAHDSSGAGGSGSPAAIVVPRLAGGKWTIDPPLGSNRLLGAAFTTANTAGNSELVDVGANGAVFWTNDGSTWTSATSGVTVDLNAVQFRNGLFVAVGGAGTIVTSPDAVTWTPRTSSTTNALTGVQGNGSGQVVAVGASGTILVSSDSVTWAAANSKTANDLHGIGYGNGRYVAVGAHGTVLTSTDGTTWTTIAPVTDSDLQSVVYGSVAATSTTPAVATFVAVGASGTLLTSPDGTTWTLRPPITAGNLASVTYGTQFVTVGAGGTILTSFDGIAWQPADSGTTTNLNCVTFTILTAKSIGVGYEAVGDAGFNLTSF